MKFYLCLFFALSFLIGCDSDPVSSENVNNFSIYLAKNIDNNSPSTKSLLELELEDESFLSVNSIDYYEWGYHKISYPDSTKEKIKSKNM